MAQQIKLNPNELKKVRSVDERLVSYNIEMTEVTEAHSGKHIRLHRLRVQKNSEFQTFR